MWNPFANKNEPVKDPNIDPSTGKPWKEVKDTAKTTQTNQETKESLERQKQAYREALAAGKTVKEAAAEAAKKK